MEVGEDDRIVRGQAELTDVDLTPALERRCGAEREVMRQRAAITTGWDLDAGGGQELGVFAELDVPPQEGLQLGPLQG